MMGITALSALLWLLGAFTLTKQDLVRLNVSPVVMAECGKQVALNCSVSSLRDGLSIKRMAWIQNNRSLCTINNEETITLHHKSTQSNFRCDYKNGHLSLVFENVQPQETGESVVYMCKLHSNHELKHAYSTLDLQECCINTEGWVTSDGAACTFTKVYPDGDVHWFLGSHKISGRLLRSNTTKRVEEGGWLTIHSFLKMKDSHVSYNCSLWSPTSRQYISSILLHSPERRVKSGVGPHLPMWIVLFVSILLLVIMN
ncbi:uncharacterized protein LOC117527028 [Thalassophryne amazonica]|uniref:uncharacterized protein LOC117527028 n=1 Tax=Thalassophryne amazonica TaxID=390379 RepID=UPI001470C2BD|nr:uncharacterized protein LOC117527028 [Thalassophryne amazonica]